MPMKILRMFLICFIIAALLNFATFFVCYIHVNSVLMNSNDSEEFEFDEPQPTTTLWDDKLRTALLCGENSTNCPGGLFEANNTEASYSTQTSDKFNGFYYYIHDAVLSNTRVCPNIPPGLGPVETDRTLLDLNAFEEMFSYIKAGGWFKPIQCIPRQSIAIIIPMQDVNRSWKNYLGSFLFYIHLFLMKQLHEYQIFVIVQVGGIKQPFSRGKLLNIGFIESLNMRKNGWDCLVFHNGFYIPTDTRNLYRCTRRPRRLIASRNVEDMQKFGGVVAIRPSIFKKVNGFSILNWRNDGDYVNMYQRLRSWNYTIETPSSSIGKYTTLKYFHVNLSRPCQPLEKSHATTPLYLIDGLTSLSYKIVNTELRQLFTFIEVDLKSQE